MQNAGQQYGQGAASSHQGTPYGHTDSSSSSTGSITSSLRQFRKKDVDKQQVNETVPSTGDSHVARVAPHNHYPPRTNENYRYPSQFDYNLTPQVKYSEISDLHPLQEPAPPTVIQKPKGKDYMDMCNVQQTHMKQPYPDHHQQYAPESNLHPAQYPLKDHQVHPMYKHESQYFPKEAQYQQVHHQIPKYNMPAQMRKFPPENDFLSKLRRIHPSMARSIMSDHHLQESQPSYQTMDQNRMYGHQNQRYMNYPSSLQGNPYPHNYMPPQNYTNYPSSCSYTRPPQMAPRFPPINPHERSISPRRGYTDNLPISPINYAALPQKISPNYPQYNAPEYAQHYQHRRAPPQEYYQQHCRTAQYIPHQMTPQEMTENRVTVSDSIKQYIENWADEETASEMTQIENNRLCKEALRVRDDQSTETVYMINASELQYLENGIPLVTSENGIPLVTSENGQYIIKSGVTIDNSTSSNGERVVNLHIMDAFKPDCMLAANKPGDINQGQDENLYHANDKPKVVIHQNTVIQPSQQNAIKDVKQTDGETLQGENKVGGSLPIIAENDVAPETEDPLEKIEESIFKDCKIETADKNCSPINVEQMEGLEDFKDNPGLTSVICATKPTARTLASVEEEEVEEDAKLKNMPIIELLPENVDIKAEKEDINESEIKKDDVEYEKVEKIEEENSAPNIKDCGDEEPIGNVENTEATTEPEAGIADEKLEENEDIKMEAEDQPIVPENLPQAKVEDDVTAEESDLPNVDNMDVDANNEEKIEDKDIAETTAGQKDAQTEEKITEDVTNNATNTEESVTAENSAPVFHEKPDKPKRTKRIFSVDDIINNIGINMNKSKNDADLAKRRRSLHTTREFLEKEIDNSNIFVLKRNATDDPVESREETAKSETKTTDAIVQEQPEKEEETKEASETTESCAEETRVIEKIDEENIECRADPNPDLNTTGASDVILPKDAVESSVETGEEISENITEETVDNNQILETLDSPIDEKTNAVICEVASIINEETTQNEVHYRNAIRVEENSVLLAIAGELVEINVTTVNGKKVITVVPLSETTVVDFNDNYETLETTEDIEVVQTKTETIETNPSDEIAEAIISGEEVIPETEIIETTSEIIIGMDISLEAEIQLDLEKPPPVLCTKAAKKSYENDLQIPSITTSEDVNDNNKRDCYNSNDKVSSSKEQDQTKEKMEKKRSDKIHSSKKTDDDPKQSKDLSEKRDKKTLKELMKVRKVKRNEVRASKEVEEEDFVPFKDLVKARNLKKQKLQQQKSGENVSADSTNKFDLEETESDLSKEKRDKEKKKSVDEIDKIKTADKKNYRKPSKSEQKNDSVADSKTDKEEKPAEPPKINSDKNCEKNDSVAEKVAKKVTFGAVDKKADGFSKNCHFEIRNYRLEDPRLKKRYNADVMVPSVSEILKENAGLENGKKRLSLEEYNKRKRKLNNANQVEPEVKTKKNDEKCNATREKPIAEGDKIKMERPKSLDDLKVPAKLKDGILAKRKFSLEDGYGRPKQFDWEETQSPKTNLNSREKSDTNRLNEFSGLINNNKSKIVIDVNDLNAKPSESSEDEILQIYKEQVDSKLSSLNLQIPRAAKPPNPFSNPETDDLMERFLKNEKITVDEMEKIKQIISYKRLMQQLNKIKSPDLTNPTTYEIRKTCAEQKDMKLHLKKVPEEKKMKRRFRNLYSDSTTESDSDFSETKDTTGAYSVVQSTGYAAGVPKLIIKRKTEMPVPVVRLERLDLGLLGLGKKRKIY